jgi:membrane-associated phospholipid phosphatase
MTLTFSLSLIRLFFMSEEIMWFMVNDAPPRFAGIYRWGLDLIRLIQKIESPGLTALMKAVTSLGGAYFYLPLLFIIFWCIDEKKGLRLGLLLLVSTWINMVLKDLLKQPRPFNLDPSVGLAFESSYGIPSGHAQMSLVFWVFMAAWGRGKFEKFKTPLTAGAVFIVLLVAFTRLYLGLHFPTDILAGWVLSGIVLGVYFLTEKRLSALFAAGGKRPTNLCLAAAAFLMILLYEGDRRLPAALLGFGLGYSLMRSSFPFEARRIAGGNRPLRLGLRCILGFAGAAVLYLALRLALPGESSLFAPLPHWGSASPYYELGSFIRYGILGLWISAGAPRLFLRLGLAAPPEAGT